MLRFHLVPLRGKACRSAAAPPPHKACGFAGTPFLGGFKSSSYKKTRHLLCDALFFGADDGTFVAPRCAVGGFRCAKSACRFAGAPPPHKACGFAGTPFLVGSSPHHVKKQGISLVMPCFFGADDGT